MRVTTVDDRCRLFFNFFSTISNFSIFPKKVIGPDASENVLGRPGGSGELLGASGGGSGRPLGRSWGSPGDSGGRLGRVLVSPSLPQRTSRNFPRLNPHSFVPTLNLS